jgi:hypothetical protein
MGPCRYCGLGASGSDRLPYRWRHLVSRIDGMSPPQSAAPCVTKLSTSTRRSRCRHLSSPRSSVASRMKPTAPTGEDPSRNHVATSPRGGGRRLDAAAACSPSRTVPGVGCGGRPQSGEVEQRQLTDADDVIVVVRGSRRSRGGARLAKPSLSLGAGHPGDESTRMKIRDLAQRWLGKAGTDRVTSGECRGPGSPAPVLCDHSGREPHRSAADAEATGLPVASSRLRPLPPGPLSDAGRWRPGQPGRRARPAPPGDRLPRCRADWIRVGTPACSVSPLRPGAAAWRGRGGWARRSWPRCCADSADGDPGCLLVREQDPRTAEACGCILTAQALATCEAWPWRP